MTEAERNALIEQFENDTWDPNEWEGLEDPGIDPVIVRFEVAPAKVVALDGLASHQGKTRGQYLNDLIDGALAMA